LKQTSQKRKTKKSELNNLNEMKKEANYNLLPFCFKVIYIYS